MGLFRKKRKVATRKPSRIKRYTTANSGAEKSLKAEPSAQANESVQEMEPVKAEIPAVEPHPAAVSGAEPEKAVMNKADAGRVFGYFREISEIPRGSYHTEAISDYLVRFAADHGLKCVQDTAHNVIISKEASEGFENADPIALQGHIDMVLASEPDKEIDLLTEHVSIIRDGDWLTADGTTLGADNGVAVAMMLAVLEDKTIAHPYLECIFTSDEEVGLLGASAIDLSGLRSRRLLNLDSETEGVFCAGCAGGAEVVCKMPLRMKNRAGKILDLRLRGLRGGHSGVEIDLGGANANVLMARMLRRLYSAYPFRLISVNGGDADNAIPTGASAGILFSGNADTEGIEAAFESAAGEMKLEYGVTDPQMNWAIKWEETDLVKAASRRSTGNLLEYLMALPNGVTHRNPVLKEMPQTSLNLGIVRTQKEEVLLELMIRSGVNSQAAYLADRIMCITNGFGGKAKLRSSYPAWEFRSESPFRDLAVETYKKLTGSDPNVEVIHAGLECGILAGKVEGLDCLSIGPDLENVHTVRERMKISSVENVWTYLLALLQAAAV